MKSGLVNASFSLPEWQAVKMIFFAPWLTTVSFFSVLWNYGHLDNGGWKYSFLYTAFGVLYTWFWRYIREGYVAVLAELGKFHLSHRDWI